MKQEHEVTVTLEGELLESFQNLLKNHTEVEETDMLQSLLNLGLTEVTEKRTFICSRVPDVSSKIFDILQDAICLQEMIKVHLFALTASHEYPEEKIPHSVEISLKLVEHLFEKHIEQIHSVYDKL